MLTWLRTRLSSFSGRMGGDPSRGWTSISLIADWLANKLWNIEAKFYSLASQGYGQNEVLYACIRLLSQSIPEPPLIAYEMSVNGATKTPLDFQHPLPKLIRNPNELMTEFEFWELTTIHMAIVGRSCWWKERNNLGEVAALWPIRPDRIGPIYSNSQEPGKKVLAGWSYQNPGTGEFIAINRSDVLTFNFPDPVGASGGIVEGFGPVQVLAKQIAADNEATKFVGALLANYAAPTVIIKVKKTIRDEDDAKLVKAKFRHEFGGANQGTPALVDGDTEITTLGFNLQQLEFPELRSISESRIAAALGTPAILVGLKVGLREGNNRASVTEQRSYYAETTLSGHWRRYQDQYTSDMAKEFGPNIICEFDITKVRAMGAHFKEKIAPIKEAYHEGVLTRNEYRSYLNLPLVEPARGDVFVMFGTNREEPIAGQIADAIGETGAGAPVDTGNHPAEPPGTDIPILPRRTTHVPNKSAIKAAPSEDDDLFQADLEGPLMDDLTAAFLPFWNEAARDIKAQKDFPEEEFILILAALLERELTNIATIQYLRSVDEFSIGFDVAELNLAASQWAKTYSYDLVRGLTNTTKGVLQEAMRKYLANPKMSDAELKAMLEPAFGRARAEMIAKTEVTRARNVAISQYAERLIKLGAKTTRVWMTRRDERVCAICAPLDGKSEEIWRGMHPFGPPAHVACRCGLHLSKDVALT
ncbi:MAG: phage portal protein [Dehalococcoidia bacterium]|nr:phage portal protein [Dehalococcoidia bacterium]